MTVAADTVALNVSNLCLAQELQRAFVDCHFDNDEKVASSKKHTQFKTRVLKPYPSYGKTKMVKIDTLLVTEMVEK